MGLDSLLDMDAVVPETTSEPDLDSHLDDATSSGIMSKVDTTADGGSKPEEGLKDIRRSEFRSIPTTERDGPVIVIESTTSSSTEEENLEWLPIKIHNQRLHLVSISDSQHSAVSSSTELTSEGGESEGEKRRPLSPSSNEVIKNFLEETFSDEGLAKDLFLLKHVNRHRHGFVSLKLLTGYKQAKKLNCDWRTLSDAAKLSRVLEVDTDGRKVRRKHPLPADLRSIPTSRTVAAVDLQEDLRSMERLAVAFGKFGSVSSLHLFKPKKGGKVPDELQSLAARVPEVAHTSCAVVEFEEVWGAAKAAREFAHHKTSLHVLYPRKKSSRSTPTSKGSPSTPSNHTKQNKFPSSHSKGSGSDRQQSMLSDWRKRIVAGEDRRDSTGSEAEESERPRNHVTRRVRAAPHQPITGSVRFSNSLPNSPLVTRRNVGNERITREPKGPNGTKGFNSPSKPNA